MPLEAGRDAGTVLLARQSELGRHTCSVLARNGRLTEIFTGVSLLPCDSRSTVACRMDWILGLQGRLAKKVSMACCRVKPLHQYMYAKAVAGALPSPACQVYDRSRFCALTNMHWIMTWGSNAIKCGRVPKRLLAVQVICRRSYR